MKDLKYDDCFSCSYEVDLYPNEPSLSYSVVGSEISGSFIPAREGIYSLRFNIVDEYGNSEVRKYAYSIGDLKTDQVDYYFRDDFPAHGQPFITNGFDSGSLLSEAPTSLEERHCGGWVQFSPDELPDYLFGIYKQIDFSIWYSSLEDGYSGAQRYVTYYGIDTDLDYSLSMDATSMAFKEFSFDVNWPSDYFWSWF
ncbi:hypothetical protein CMI41_00820 [Candidatus Pacearchaeota archaeon]|nr:hypothetical protein [Candidatus Pacearchaeota archaeon]|tara:strand:- start:3545 stop:4135 length:591 start_codon:yes stop_codon:yes gene_type:complete